MVSFIQMEAIKIMGIIQPPSEITVDPVENKPVFLIPVINPQLREIYTKPASEYDKVFSEKFFVRKTSFKGKIMPEINSKNSPILKNMG